MTSSRNVHLIIHGYHYDCYSVDNHLPRPADAIDCEEALSGHFWALACGELGLTADTEGKLRVVNSFTIGERHYYNCIVE